ncbi:hypothetical protein [Stenotrophomonas sp. S4]
MTAATRFPFLAPSGQRTFVIGILVLTLVAWICIAAVLAIGGRPVGQLVQLPSLDLYANYELPILTRGSKNPTAQVWLSRGELWKFGTTQNADKRYSQKYLSGIGTGGVELRKEFVGTKAEALTLEQMKIDNFLSQTGQLPPGNKVRR